MLSKETVYTKIRDHLDSKGFKIYSPAVKTGDCTSPYIVIKYNGGSSTQFSTKVVYYDVMIYVPRDSYSTLGTLIEQVREAMKELYPLVKPSGTETPSYYDDEFKAHMYSIQYQNYIKN